MSLWLDDGDVRLYHGNALDVLAGLPDVPLTGIHPLRKGESVARSDCAPNTTDHPAR